MSSQDLLEKAIELVSDFRINVEKGKQRKKNIEELSVEQLVGGLQVLTSEYTEIDNTINMLEIVSKHMKNLRYEISCLQTHFREELNVVRGE